MASSEGAAASGREKGATSSVRVVVGEILRNAAGEAVKGRSLAETTTRIVADAVETIDERGPELARNAGIMTWRYAALGWATWRVGRFLVGRRRRQARVGEERRVSRTRRRRRSAGRRRAHRA